MANGSISDNPTHRCCLLVGCKMCRIRELLNETCLRVELIRIILETKSKYVTRARTIFALSNTPAPPLHRKR